MFPKEAKERPVYIIKLAVPPGHCLVTYEEMKTVVSFKKLTLVMKVLENAVQGESVIFNFFCQN